MDKVLTFIESHLAEPMAKLSEQRHLRAVRDGIISTLPIIIVGSFFLILAFPPVPAGTFIAVWAAENIVTILLPFRLTMFIMSLYAAFGIGHSLARSYDVDGLSGGQIAVVAFLMTTTPRVAEGMGWVLPMGVLGGGGMFVAIIVSLLAVEIQRTLLRSKFKITMPEQVPAAVARSFENLTPVAVVVVLMTFISYVFGFDWHGTVGRIVAPLVTTSDTWIGIMIPVLLITMFWSAGIHGVSVVGAVARPIWTVMLEANSAGVASGLTGTALPHIGAEPFYQWFIWIGGSGATIGLVILLAFFSKAKYSKSLGRTALLPGLFNINEPLVFGAPIVLNPILIIPFVLAPMVMGTIAFIVTTLGLVNRVSVIPPWTLPGPIGAYLATGGDWRAIVLSLVLIVVAILIYLPFFRVYDKQQCELEKE